MFLLLRYLNTGYFQAHFKHNAIFSMMQNIINIIIINRDWSRRRSCTSRWDAWRSEEKWCWTAARPSSSSTTPCTTCRGASANRSSVKGFSCKSSESFPPKTNRTGFYNCFVRKFSFEKCVFFCKTFKQGPRLYTLFLTLTTFEIKIAYNFTVVEN